MASWVWVALAVGAAREVDLHHFDGDRDGIGCET
jgi:hypothetical protein